jgi:hypothetical protein
VVVVLAVLAVVGLVVTERVGRAYAEGQIESRLRASGVNGDIHVSVGSSWWRPTVLPALVTGDIDRVTVTVTDGSLLGLPVDDVHYTLGGLHGDVSLLGGTVVVRSLDGGTFEMRVPPEVIGDSLGIPAAVRNGRLVGGAERSPLEVRVQGDQLVFSGPSLGERSPQTLPVADSYILPCRPVVSVEGGALRLACTGDRVPGILDAPLQGDEPADVGPASPGQLPPPQTTAKPPG